jgi:hypothetical protein
MAKSNNRASGELPGEGNGDVAVANADRRSAWLREGRAKGGVANSVFSVAPGRDADPQMHSR